MATETLTLEVTQDHVDRLSTAKKPVLGIAELIWNSLDADATEVTVQLNRNALNGIDTIEVIDNGLGITRAEAREGFGHLGGSWKKRERQTKREKRILHGKQGQGRFRAFAVCETVEWYTAYLEEGGLKQFRITGKSSDKRNFQVTDEQDGKLSASGTSVLLSNLVSQQSSLHSEKAVLEFNKLFAIYLKQYHHVRISYDGTIVNPTSFEELTSTYELPPFTTEEGKQYSASVTIIEWTIDIDRALYLCSENGFTLRELNPGIQAPGYRFTAYLRSKLLEEMDEAGTIDMDEFTDLKKLLDTAKDQMRQHFLKRDADKAASVVDRWKEDQIYPFEGDPRDILEETQRQMFDVVAVSLDSYVSDFIDLKPKNKKFTFKLLRYALESNPAAMQYILDQVVGLPKDKQDEFASLLKRTSLVAMINAAKIVADRLDFLKGLEYLLFDKESKAALLERSQLHKLVSDNTWIFGDEFYLVNNDESLTNVLRRHVEHADFEVDLDTPVVREDGSEGVVDILLSDENAETSPEKDVIISKILPRQIAEPKHHLVIELKRPKQPINSEVISQVRSYAFAIATDERFTGIRTNWTFWALSNEMTEQARLEAEVANLPKGVVFQTPSNGSRNYGITIWARTWSEVIEQCTGRLKFFQERLNYTASQSSGRKYLQDTYPKFIPRKATGERAA